MKTHEIEEKLQRAYKAMLETIEVAVETEGKNIHEALDGNDGVD